MFRSSDGHAFRDETPRHVLPWGLVALFCTLSGCYLTHEREAPVVEEVPPEPPVACDGRLMVCPTEEGCDEYVRELCNACGSLPPVPIDVSEIARQEGESASSVIPASNSPLVVRLPNATLINVELRTVRMLRVDPLGRVLEVSEPSRGVVAGQPYPDGAVFADLSWRTYRIDASGRRGEELFGYHQTEPADIHHSGDSFLRILANQGQFFDFYGEPEGASFELSEPVEYPCTPIRLGPDDWTAAKLSMRRTGNGGFLLPCLDRSTRYSVRVFDSRGRRLGEWSRDLDTYMNSRLSHSGVNWWDEGNRRAQRLNVSRCGRMADLGAPCPLYSVDVDADGFPLVSDLVPLAPDDRLGQTDWRSTSGMGGEVSPDEIAAVFADQPFGDWILLPEGVLNLELRRMTRDGRLRPVATGVQVELNDFPELSRDGAGYFLVYRAAHPRGRGSGVMTHQRFCAPD